MYGNAIMVLLFGLAFTGLGTALSYQPVKLLFTGIAIEGKVSDVEKTDRKNSDGKRSTSYRPKIEYECNDSGKIEQRSSFSSNHPYNVWEILHLRCDPNNPHEVAIIDVTNLWGVIVALIGLFFTIWGIIKFKEAIYNSKKRKQLLAQGLKISAVISEITRSGSRINKQRAYIITAIYQNHTFISEECFFEVGNYLGVWDSIEVYIDPSNPSYYWVNTEYITSLPPRTYTTLPATVLAMSTSDLIKYQQNNTALIQLMQSHWLPVELRNTQTQIPPEAITMFKHMLDTEIKKRQS